MLQKCEDCRHCDKEMMLCHSDSKDCKDEYALDKNDLETYSRCDFFSAKRSCVEDYKESTTHS